jgi:hypothetical protein
MRPPADGKHSANTDFAGEAVNGSLEWARMSTAGKSCRDRPRSSRAGFRDFRFCDGWECWQAPEKSGDRSHQSKAPGNHGDAPAPAPEAVNCREEERPNDTAGEIGREVESAGGALGVIGNVPGESVATAWQKKVPAPTSANPVMTIGNASDNVMITPTNEIPDPASKATRCPNRLVVRPAAGVTISEAANTA